MPPWNGSTPRRRPRRSARPRTPFPTRPRAICFGTSAFAVPTLRALAGVAEVTLVVTQPDRPAHRGKRSVPTPVKVAALELGIPTFEPERLRDAVERLASERAEIFVVASYGKIIPQRALDLVPVALNVHPSLLPLYRGATPLQSQLRDGVRRSGVSIIAMDAGMDTGDVVLAREATIGDEETYGSLHDRFAELGAELLAESVRAFVRGDLARTPQRLLGGDGDAARTLTRPLTKDDLRLSLAWSARRIADHVRALAPQPLARVRLGADDVKIARAAEAGPARSARLRDSAVLLRLAAAEDENGEEGRMPALEIRSAAPDAVTVMRDDGAVLLERVVPPSRGEMSGAAYLRSRVAASRDGVPRA